MSAPIYVVRRSLVEIEVGRDPRSRVVGAAPVQFELGADDPRPVAAVEDQLDADRWWRLLCELTDRADYVPNLRAYRAEFYARARLRQDLAHLDVMISRAAAVADRAGVPIPAAPSRAPIHPSNRTP